MRQVDFRKLIEIEDDNTLMLKQGDIFLYGKNMIAQKSNKDVGQEISYFKLVKKDGLKVEYTIIFDVLEE